jgi:hypothetical protein
MNIKNRIRNIERINAANQLAWIQSLSAAELEKIIEQKQLNSKFPHFDEFFNKWIKTLTDSELLIIRENRPGAARLERKFYEYYQKKNRQTRK